ncbi:hypothetical protein, partial [Actinoallomurus acaciae]
MCIQLVAAARKDGLTITPRAVFEHRTPAGLARVVRVAADGAEARPGDETGDVPLTPIVAWLRAHGGPYDRFVQSATIALPEGCDDRRLAAVLAAVVAAHPMLRLRADLA